MDRNVGGGDCRRCLFRDDATFRFVTFVAYVRCCDRWSNVGFADNTATDSMDHRHKRRGVFS